MNFGGTFIQIINWINEAYQGILQNWDKIIGIGAITLITIVVIGMIKSIIF